jgi:5'-deoxynucleotidase YfbR-like HD superfamily hydrolase
MFPRELRDTAFVPRWAIVRTLRQQSVAEHSYFVALYAQRIAHVLEWQGPMDKLLTNALYHDLDEILSGDIASPAKQVIKKASGVGYNLFVKWLFQQTEKRVPYYAGCVEGMGEWEKDITAITKTADILEAVLFLCDEEFMGNRNVVHCREDLFDQMEESLKRLPNQDNVENLKVFLTNAITTSLYSQSMLVHGNERIK